ncbi:heat stress transcription factor C-2b isoform X3 [Sorghum bicolor]|uniref:heat stress transcription factor C-2b isoform X3 n=1 Tax=Sorghum bicolor TaxID=4558 RepID=UPI000B42467A|nr:heat stress transcription factor C-2b isoform X3 [Sorghum bicolor]|eukprot:XP_021306219.1 heat stress transcription factor C-2b isoform X3 [Sorghum bicolor]
MLFVGQKKKEIEAENRDPPSAVAKQSNMGTLNMHGENLFCPVLLWISARTEKAKTLYIQDGFRKVDPDRWEFAHASFLRGQTHLLRNIVRRGSSGSAGGGGGGGGGKRKDAPASVNPVEPSAEDIAMVATEVVRLKQEQRTIDDRVAAMWRRVQETERRPKQMLAFLLKVVGDRDRLHRLVGDGGTAAAPGPDNNGFASGGAAAAEEGGEKRARLLLDGDNMVALGPEAVDFAGFYSGGGVFGFGDVAVDAAAGSGGGGCSFAFGGGY